MCALVSHFSRSSHKAEVPKHGLINLGMKWPQSQHSVWLSCNYCAYGRVPLWKVILYLGHTNLFIFICLLIMFLLTYKWILATMYGIPMLKPTDAKKPHLLSVVDAATADNVLEFTINAKIYTS